MIYIMYIQFDTLTQLMKKVAGKAATEITNMRRCTQGGCHILVAELHFRNE